MNILILNWRDPKNPQAGGAEIVTLAHARAWAKAGHAVTWFTSSFTDAPHQERVQGVEIIRLGNSITVYFLAPFFYLFSGRKFDVVIDEIHGIPFFTPLYVHQPKVAFIHEVAGEIWDSMYPWPFNWLGRLAENLMFWLYRKMKFWTDAPSTVAELVGRGIPRSNCIAIPCPIANKASQSPIKKESTPTFIFVGRLVKMKGLEEVIKAFALILKKGINARLWVVGDGPVRYVEQVKKFAEQERILANIIFFGRLKEPKKLKLMARAHLLWHASVKEGWGLVVLEAASQGTPAVVYDVPGLCDTVKHKETGIVLGENSPQALAEASLVLLNNPDMYARLQKNGLSWSKSFSWDKVTKQSLNLLKG